MVRDLFFMLAIGRRLVRGWLVKNGGHGWSWTKGGGRSREMDAVGGRERKIHTSADFSQGRYPRLSWSFERSSDPPGKGREAQQGSIFRIKRGRMEDYRRVSTDTGAAWRARKDREELQGVPRSRLGVLGEEERM